MFPPGPAFSSAVIQLMGGGGVLRLDGHVHVAETSTVSLYSFPSSGFGVSIFPSSGRYAPRDVSHLQGTPHPPPNKPSLALDQDVRSVESSQV